MSAVRPRTAGWLLRLAAGDAVVCSRRAASCMAMVRPGRAFRLALIGSVAAPSSRSKAWCSASLRDTEPTPLKRTAILLTGELGGSPRASLFGAGGGVAPARARARCGHGARSEWLPADRRRSRVVLRCCFARAGELLERYLFFTAVGRAQDAGRAAS